MSVPQNFIPSSPDSPLTAGHLNDIQNALRALDVAENRANLAARAGIDVSDHLTSIQSSRAQLLKIKNVYFPGQ